MHAATIALVTFIFMLCGVLVGVRLRRAIPGEHLNVESRDVVKLGAGLIATQAALVLGLLVSSANSSFDSMNSGMIQVGTKFLTMDRALSQYGPETKELRHLLRSRLIFIRDQIWPANGQAGGGVSAIEQQNGSEFFSEQVRALVPQTESQTAIKAQVLQTTAELAVIRWELIENATGSIPMSLVEMLIFWFSVLLLMFGLLTPSNTTVNTVMIACAFSVAAGIFLILEMSQPLQGYVKVSSAPLDKALEHLGR